MRHFHMIYIVCTNQLMNLLTDLLDECSEPVWLVTNTDIIKTIEFALWESLRLGISGHLAGLTPCTAHDLDRLLALLRKAIGKMTRQI